VISTITPKGNRIFPEDFVQEPIEEIEIIEIKVPGTPLQLDPNSQTTVISPKRHFRYDAKNPSEAKYIVYAHQIGLKKIKIPKDNRAVFKAVTSYEKYCREIMAQSFDLFLEYTNDEDLADHFTKELVKKLGLRAKEN